MDMVRVRRERFVLLGLYRYPPFCPVLKCIFIFDALVGCFRIGFFRPAFVTHAATVAGEIV